MVQVYVQALTSIINLLHRHGDGDVQLDGWPTAMVHGAILSSSGEALLSLLFVKQHAHGKQLAHMGESKGG